MFIRLRTDLFGTGQSTVSDTTPAPSTHLDRTRRIDLVIVDPSAPNLRDMNWPEPLAGKIAGCVPQALADYATGLKESLEALQQKIPSLMGYPHIAQSALDQGIEAMAQMIHYERLQTFARPLPPEISTQTAHAYHAYFRLLLMMAEPDVNLLTIGQIAYRRCATVGLLDESRAILSTLDLLKHSNRNFATIDSFTACAVAQLREEMETVGLFTKHGDSFAKINAYGLAAERIQGLVKNGDWLAACLMLHVTCHYLNLPQCNNYKEHLYPELEKVGLHTGLIRSGEIEEGLRMLGLAEESKAKTQGRQVPVQDSVVDFPDVPDVWVVNGSNKGPVNCAQTPSSANKMFGGPAQMQVQTKVYSLPALTKNRMKLKTTFGGSGFNLFAPRGRTVFGRTSMPLIK